VSAREQIPKRTGFEIRSDSPNRILHQNPDVLDGVGSSIGPEPHLRSGFSMALQSMRYWRLLMAVAVCFLRCRVPSVWWANGTAMEMFERSVDARPYKP